MWLWEDPCCGPLPIVPTSMMDFSVGSDDIGEATINSSESSKGTTPPVEKSSSSVSVSSSGSRSSKGVGELVNTSSFARRLAHGEEPTKRDPSLVHQSEAGDMTVPPSAGPEPEDSATSSIQSSQDVVISDTKRGAYDTRLSSSKEALTADTTASVTTSEGGGGESTIKASIKTVTISESKGASDAPFTTADGKAGAVSVTGGGPPALKTSTAAYYSGPPPPKAREISDSAKNPFNAFGDYIAFFFNKAEVYEEELERQESVRQLHMDKTHHGSKRRALVPKSFVEGDSSSSDDISIDGNENETEVKKESMKEKHSFQMEEKQSSQKKQKVEVVADEAPSEPEEVVDEKMKEIWKNNWEVFVVGKKKDKFPEVAIERLALPLSVEEFTNYVIEDDAAHSIGKFMRDIGELEVNTTPWKQPQTPDASKPTTRTIHYTHPVNAPMAPPRAKARKHQSLHKFGNVGLCVETCTVVEEVPMADCFVVNDRLWVREAEGENEGCVVSVTFQIKFVKGTMFRRIIETQTRKEYVSYYDQFASMIRSLKSPSASEEGALVEVAMELEEATLELEERISVTEGKGVEVPLSALLNRISKSSRRLSIAAKTQSRRAMDAEVSEERSGTDKQRVLAFARDRTAHIKKQLSESDGRFVLACGVIFFMVLLNMMALKQMMMMNRFLHDLDTRLGKMNEINEGLWLKLAGGNDDGSCLT